MLAFNIMARFKQRCLTNSRSRQQLSTIRFLCIAVGSYLVTKGRNKVIIPIRHRRPPGLLALFSHGFSDVIAP